MIRTHNLGFPRVGAKRDLKFAVEAYWRKEIDLLELQNTSKAIRQKNWQYQADAGLDFVSVGDFSWYDHILDTSMLLGAIPERVSKQTDDATQAYFLMARGQTPEGHSTQACEMTKWFDTNYHYIVPELKASQSFTLSADKILNQIKEAQTLNHNVKPVIVGPLTYLWLAKIENNADKLVLLDKLIPVYQQLLSEIHSAGVSWIQIDEPILGLELPATWQSKFESVYNQLQTNGLNILLATYFSRLEENLEVVRTLPVQAIHVDCIRDSENIEKIVDWLPTTKTLSLGIIDGRNIWKSDLLAIYDQVKKIQSQFSGDIWIAPSCSLLHVPVDLKNEIELDTDIRSWLAFAAEKLEELNTLKTAINVDLDAVDEAFSRNQAAIQSRRTSTKIHNAIVKQRCENISEKLFFRTSPYQKRAIAQKNRLQLPLLPTTTIGSFPQTPELRKIRANYKKNTVDQQSYELAMQEEIKRVIDIQEHIGLDVLVHGEAERNDMVEYFGEQLDGFSFTKFGWVQSYGSRCVKPPIIFGDVQRPNPMTVKWIQYAQAQTDKLVKGMLTGPVTILNWSFVRDDQPRAQTCQQISLALRREVQELEAVGIKIIQIDEAAIREGLPLRKIDQEKYLKWAVDAFKLCSSGVRDETQIHTHMCYSNFNDIITDISRMDADVITIETSRSAMKLLKAFEVFSYPNEVGPGVYDIHSPNVPTVDDIVSLITKAQQSIPLERLWINPDCGLKTRHWPETETALKNMVKAAFKLRKNSQRNVA